MFENINDNKYFIGISMILVNIGSRFIISELSDSQKKFINNIFLRRIFLFCVFFMATRDVISSIVLTIMFVLLISELFNENSEISLVSNDDDENNHENKGSKLENDKKIQDIIDSLYQVKNNL